MHILEHNYTYHIAGFLRKDFNLAIGLTHNIKICKIYTMLHFVTRVHFVIIITKLNTIEF